MKKPYVAPQLTVVTFKIEQGYAASGRFTLFGLGDTYNDRDGDAWSDNTSSGSNHFGGWTDNGGSAWD